MLNPILRSIASKLALLRVFLGPKAPLIGPVRVGACMISNHIKCHIDGQDQNGRKH